VSLPAVKSNRQATSGELVAAQPSRDWLLEQLRQVLEIAMERVGNSKTSASYRIRWSRIVIAAGQALNSVLRDVEIEALKQQINQLKELATAQLSEDEQGNDQDGDTETSTDD